MISETNIRYGSLVRRHAKLRLCAVANARTLFLNVRNSIPSTIVQLEPMSKQTPLDKQPGKYYVVDRCGGFMKIFSAARRWIIWIKIRRIERKLETAEGHLAWTRAECCPFFIPMIPALQATVTQLREKRDNLLEAMPCE